MEGTMKKKFMVLVVLLCVFLFSGLSNAGSLDDSLNKAKAEGKIVMLELGSVGCIPCEQMKPVMSKLSESYKGKMQVIFIDVRKDRDAARRFGVFMIPVQVFLDKGGKEFHRHAGFYSYEEIVPVLRKAGI
jgi:thioredoxin 1